MLSAGTMVNPQVLDSTLPLKENTRLFKKKHRLSKACVKPECDTIFIVI